MSGWHRIRGAIGGSKVGAFSSSVSAPVEHRARQLKFKWELQLLQGPPWRAEYSGFVQQAAPLARACPCPPLMRSQKSQSWEGWSRAMRPRPAP